MSLISIVIPVYFNEGSLEILAQRLDLLSQEHPQHQFEFIYVDDGSGDQSYAAMTRIAEKDSRVRLVKLIRNFGSNMAILAGISHARGDCVGFIAADLQDPPESLSEMIRLWEDGKKVIFAIRKDRAGDPFLTRVYANIFNWLFEKLVFSGISSTGIGFFMIDRQVVEVIIQFQERNSHLIGLILWTGFPYATVTYDRVERKHGKSRWNFSRKLNYFIDTFAAFSYLPLRLASIFGFIFASAGGLYALILILLRLFGSTVEVQGWTALMVVVLLISGVQLVILGIIGEYLWRNFDASRKRPLFIVEEEFSGARAVEQHEEVNLGTPV
jgi:dolichol-phosphate mannosyltransferase